MKKVVVQGSFPNLLYTVCRSSIASPLGLLDIFFKLCSSLDNADSEVFLLEGGGGGGEASAVKDGIDHNRLRPQLHAQDCNSRILLSSRVSL